MDLQKKNRLSTATPILLHEGSGFFSSSEGLNSDPSVFSSSSSVVDLSWKQSIKFRAASVSLTFFWVLYFVFPGLTNLTHVRSPLSYCSLVHFAGNVNFCMLPAPIPRFSNAFLDFSCNTFFLSRFDIFLFFFGGAILDDDALPDVAHAVNAFTVTQHDAP